MKIEGNLIDIYQNEIYPACVTIQNGRIESIVRNHNEYLNYISPPLIDSHVHIESSMLIPSEFAKLAIACGTVAVVSDPHEIANVMGVEGVKFMIENGLSSPLKFYFCAPSCVPATNFETSGSNLSSAEIENLFATQPIIALGEMMNFPGVIMENDEVLNKLNIALKYKKPIDGHAPGLTGELLTKYISSHITTDHECFSLKEALEKISLGMKVLIREGSAAKNFTELHSLIATNNKDIMLCTDDSHPDDLIQYGHIDKIIRMGLSKGLDIFNLLRAASLNPIIHYKLGVGCLKVNDSADFIIVEDLNNFNITHTYIDGNLVYSNNRILFETKIPKPLNNFNRKKHLTVADIEVPVLKNKKLKVIEAFDGSLLTSTLIEPPLIGNGFAISDIDRDILKIVVVNRYNLQNPVIGFIKGFNLKQGAMASTIAHDSHNIIAVGANDYSILQAINELIDKKGGICFVSGRDFYTIPLPFGGLMTSMSGILLAEQYKQINSAVKSSGSNLNSPFMTLSFMALLVIPSLKIGDKGLFDIDKYSFQKLWS